LNFGFPSTGPGVVEGESAGADNGGGELAKTTGEGWRDAAFEDGLEFCRRGGLMTRTGDGDMREIIGGGEFDGGRGLSGGRVLSFSGLSLSLTSIDSFLVIGVTCRLGTGGGNSTAGGEVDVWLTSGILLGWGGSTTVGATDSRCRFG
jgi:hypothetical protein